MAPEHRRPFADRAEAGAALAQALLALPWAAPVVLALPRGGVPVAAVVARALDAPLDLVLVRKIGAPGNPERAVAAVAEAWPPQTGTHLACDAQTRAMSGTANGFIEHERARQEQEIARRRRLYLTGRARAVIAGAETILVDDGVATGTTVRAALLSLRAAGVGRVVLAVPVAPAQALRELTPLVDRMVCLWQPPSFHAVGLHYRDFAQVADDEVVRLLQQARRPDRASRPLAQPPMHSAEPER